MFEDYIQPHFSQSVTLYCRAYFLHLYLHCYFKMELNLSKVLKGYTLNFLSCYSLEEAQQNNFCLLS